MILSIFLSLGESWEDLEIHGQDELFIKNNLHNYSRKFERIYVFSYGKKSTLIHKNIFVLPNRFGLHRFIYTFLCPLLYQKELRESNVIRGMQVTGGIPALFAKLLYKKNVVINYGYDYARVAWIEKKYLHSLVHNILDKILLPTFDAIIYTAPFLKRHLSLMSARHMYYIPNGINTTIFKPRQQTKKYDVLFVGRLEQQKNPLLLLRALQLVKKTLRVAIVGTGSMKKVLFEKATKSRAKIFFIDKVPHSKLPTYYNRARLFILPSSIEGHPKALLEAMSCGMAVIGSDVEGIREVITSRHNGLLVSPTIPQLVYAINLLLANSQLCKKLGVMARKTIQQKFNSEQTWNKEIRLLSKLAV